MKRRARTRLALLAAVLASVTAAHAQFPGGGGGRGGMGGAPHSRNAPDGARDGPGMGVASDPVAQMSMDLASLEEDLKLASAQGGAWALYADRLRKFAADVARNRSTMRFPKEAAPQQFELLVTTATNRLTAIEEIAEAGKALYAGLTQDQREIADRRLARIVTPLVTGDLPPGMAAMGGGPRGAGPRGEPGGPR